MKYTLVLQLSGALAEAVAVEWTDLDAPAPDGTGWEPCICLADGRWRFASREGSALQPHLREPGVFGNIAIRYRLDAAGPWSETSADRKEITIVAAEEDDSVTLPPAVPALIGGLGLAGAGKIGSPVTAEPGLWSGEPTAFAYQWCRDGAGIAGATEAVYTPVADDDLTELSCRVAATGAGGQGEAVTAALRVTHVAPTAKGGLFDEIFDQGTGMQLVETAWDFTGEALVFSVEGAGATVEPETGVVGVPTDAPLAGEVVTVTATNSGGSAASAFPVTVEETADLLVALEADEWEIVELAEDPVHKGMVTAVVRFPANSPARNAIAAYWSDMSDPAAGAHPTYDLGLDADGCRRFRLRPGWKDSNTWHVRAPGESKANIAIRYRLEPLVTDTGSPMDHWLEENRALVSEDSADRKSFTVPTNFFGAQEESKRTPTVARSSIDFENGCKVTFSKSMQCGQFWDGSWFVVNPSGGGGFSITDWTPNGSSGTHGVMVNPREGQNGFESTQQGSSAHHLSYSSTHDKAPNRNGSISFSAGEQASVIKCISVGTDYDAFPRSWRGWHTDQDRHYIVTVLREAPPVGSFRPAAHADVDKTPIATIYDIDWAKVPNLSLRLPSQDLSFLTLENAKSAVGGQPNRGNGNYNGMVVHGFTIRSQSQLARKNGYGGLHSYGSFWAQSFLSALFYLFSSSTSTDDKKFLLHSIVQLGLEAGQTLAVINEKGFHGNTWGMSALCGLTVLKDGALRNTLIANVRSSRTMYPDNSFKYVPSNVIAGGSAEMIPLEGGDPQTRRHNAGGSWPMDFPFLSAHVGMPHFIAEWSDPTNADYGAKPDTWKAKQYHMEVFIVFMLGQIEGGYDALNHTAAFDWVDRYMYWWEGHYRGWWDMPTSNSEEWRKFDGDWRVERFLWEAYRDHRSRIRRVQWKGKPDQPFAPVLSKSGTNIVVDAGYFRCGNGNTLTKCQYRVRVSTSRSSTSGWSAWTDAPASLPALGNRYTFTIPRAGSGSNQVQIRYVNSAGNGIESLNIPYNADGAPGPGRQPGGNLAQITI